MNLNIPRAKNFTLTGNGSNSVWKKVQWQSLFQVGDRPSPYRTQAKVIYSSTGIYFLIRCDDKKTICTYKRDWAPLFKEDVIEVFLQPDEKRPVYLEYEISPLGYELPLLIINSEGKFTGWTPWDYTKTRKVKKLVSLSRLGWIAEFFIPFKLMRGLRNVPPKKNTQWKANINRIDYDRLPRTKWAWCPHVKGKFHQYKKFGTFTFH